MKQTTLMSQLVDDESVAVEMRVREVPITRQKAV